MTSHYVIADDALNAIQGTALYYPCSGSDTSCSIELFSNFISDYWFVDIAYFSTETKKPPPLLGNDSQFLFIGQEIVGPLFAAMESRVDSESGKSYNYLEPCVVTEKYRHITSGVEIKIHRRRGFGLSGFRKHISKLGVFFYRGDSQGESGSGNLWLDTDRINEICDKLVDGGLIVTDDSQHSGRDKAIYKEIWKNNQKKAPSLSPQELIQSYKSFTDRKGRRFTCIGYAGQRYGPTMIWQVYKSAQQSVVPEKSTTASLEVEVCSKFHYLRRSRP